MQILRELRIFLTLVIFAVFVTFAVLVEAFLRDLSSYKEYSRYICYIYQLTFVDQFRYINYSTLVPRLRGIKQKNKIFIPSEPRSDFFCFIPLNASESNTNFKISELAYLWLKGLKENCEFYENCEN